jgi:hypothetical protein
MLSFVIVVPEEVMTQMLVALETIKASKAKKARMKLETITGGRRYENATYW